MEMRFVIFALETASPRNTCLPYSFRVEVSRLLVHYWATRATSTTSRLILRTTRKQKVPLGSSMMHN
jgi:hypothetical protein